MLTDSDQTKPRLMTDVPRALISGCPHNVRFQRESRLIVLTLSFVEIDPVQS